MITPRWWRHHFHIIRVGSFSFNNKAFQKRCNNIHNTNDISEVDNIKLQIGNKIEKLKLFFAEGSLEARNIFGQFLMTAFEAR